MLSLVNITSAVGNNSSIYPLLVRDCGIEIPTKIFMTYNQNLKDSKQMANNAVREKSIDEYGTSAIWLGGIPFIEWICNKIIKILGFNPKINSSLFKENKQQGIKYNINKFKDLAPKEVKELEKVSKNKKTFERLLAGKFILSTAIPVALMGYFLPKANFGLTEKIKKEQEAKQDLQKSKERNQTISFKGNAISSLANMSTVNKMAITDGGLTIGRIETARNQYEKMEKAFQMGGMMFLNFVAPLLIAEGLDKLSGQLFNTNVNLDPKILNDKEFINAIKTKSLKLPKDNIIEFLDNNPQEKFSKLASEFCEVKYLKNGSRDPREYINEKKIKAFSNEIENFAKQANASQDVEKFAKKALKVKSGNIFANITISSFLLAVALPKATFILRKKVTGSDAEPGLMKIA